GAMVSMLAIPCGAVVSMLAIPGRTVTTVRFIPGSAMFGRSVFRRLGQCHGADKQSQEKPEGDTDRLEPHVFVSFYGELPLLFCSEHFMSTGLFVLKACLS